MRSQEGDRAQSLFGLHEHWGFVPNTVSMVYSIAESWKKATCIWTTRWWLVTSKICSEWPLAFGIFFHFFASLLTSKESKFFQLILETWRQAAASVHCKNSFLDLLTCIIQSSKLETQSLETSCCFCWCINNCLDLLTLYIIQSSNLESSPWRAL